MHILALLIMGMALLIGILIYYIISTRPGGGSSYDANNGTSRKKRSATADLKREDNVIFLPNDKNEDHSDTE